MRCCRLGLIGDLGQTENSAQTLDHLTASDPGSVINVGDLSYADGYQPPVSLGRCCMQHLLPGRSNGSRGGSLCRRWDSWGRLIAPHTSRYAWANIEGNHEIEVPACALFIAGCPSRQRAVLMERRPILA